MKSSVMWEEYRTNCGINGGPMPEQWKFCGGGREGDMLAELVIRGEKTATASYYDIYRHEDERLPKEGSFGIILYDSGEAACIIKTVGVSVTEFDRVPRYHAFLEGEGDGSIEYWREVHGKAFENNCRECGIKFSHRGKVVLERFLKVYPCETDGIILIMPSEKYSDDIESYRDEFLNAGDSLDGTGNLGRYDNINEWISDSVRFADESENVSPLVHATQLMAVRLSDNRIVGMIQLRHSLNDYLWNFGGNIGYSVRPSERRKGYAGTMLKKTLPFAKAAGLSRVLVTCSDVNEASRRTILSAGGVYENTIRSENDGINTERYWIYF